MCARVIYNVHNRSRLKSVELRGAGEEDGRERLRFDFCHSVNPPLSAFLQLDINYSAGYQVAYLPLTDTHTHTHFRSKGGRHVISCVHLNTRRETLAFTHIQVQKANANT